jgi:hypothetical protein
MGVGNRFIDPIETELEWRGDSAES